MTMVSPTAAVVPIGVTHRTGTDRSDTITLGVR